MPAPLLISLPLGMSVGGVNTFALRLVNGLAAAGRPAALLLHPEPDGVAKLDVPFHPRVEVLRPPVPRFEESPGDLSPFIPHYLGAIRRLAAQSGSPVAFAPQLHADGYGIAAALSLTDPHSLRVLGWQHGMFEYDSQTLARYEPIIARFVAVSDSIESTLKQRLPGRAADIVNLPCGVEAHPPRADRRNSTAPADRPLRLIYTGRIEHQTKRILTLTHLADELRGTPHSITAVGDGPAAAEFDAAATSRPTLKRLLPQSPAAVAELLATSDLFVLPSRTEGLSVSMLEAMAAGCVPILARTESGAAQVIEPGYNGEIADVGPDADERSAARALAVSIRKFLARPAAARAAMAEAARQTIVERFSLDRHLAAASALIDSAVQSPPRSWPADRPCAFTASALGQSSSSGSVPVDGPRRLRALLESLAGRTIIIHGTGQHTLQLGAILASSPARIAAFTDDDPQRHGQMLWNWPIIAPESAAKTSATDVVISSWMHQQAIWSRRAAFESRGLRVHRVYESANS